jgi:nitrate reductase NapAB chaperone NapD
MVTASSLIADGAIIDNKAEACEHIKSAISLLSQCAIENSDSTKVVEESIANLGVIILDLCN